MAGSKKKGLGKGLSALIGGADTSADPEPVVLDTKPEALSDGTRLTYVDPRTVKPNPQQPRQNFDEESLQELAASIRNDGVLEPVVVREVNGDYELVSGERRVRASVLAELDEVPAVVREVTDEDMLKLGIIENIQREELNPIELAQAYQSLTDAYGWSQEKVAQQVGKKRATITNAVRLLKLPEDIQAHVVDGAISMGHARALLSVPDPLKQRKLCTKIVKDGLSVREVETAAQRTNPKTSGAASQKPAKDPHLASLEDQLRIRYGTKVTIKSDKKYKGKIELDFYSLSDLERLLDLLK
jgi:ParB family chromosome partitioning protein